MQDAGLSDEVIVATGALPISFAGRAWGVRPQILAMHPRVAARPLALSLLQAIVEGRFRAPKAASPAEYPPSLMSRMHRI